ncbi:MAG: hypothetical protein LBT50_01080 [Prevotellaceae bacterium]|jgi:hypothetical protein|nr:hypothetical protein [Prevotellaceae bacterium]
MSEPQAKRRKQLNIARSEIVAELYKKGWSYRQIQTEVIRRLGLKSYSKSVIHSDVQKLLAEWRENRIENIDNAIQLELERIDDTIRELWAQWEKSKEDYKKTSNKRKGKPASDKPASDKPAPDKPAPERPVAADIKIRTIETEMQETEMRCLGDVSYIAEIRAQLIERRKLLGLYAPEKKDVTIQEFDLNGLTPEQRQVLLQVGEQILNEKE